MFGLIAGALWVLALCIPAVWLLRSWQVMARACLALCALACACLVTASSLALLAAVGGAPVGGDGATPFTHTASVPMVLLAGPSIDLRIDAVGGLALLLANGIGFTVAWYAAAAPKTDRIAAITALPLLLFLVDLALLSAHPLPRLVAMVALVIALALLVVPTVDDRTSRLGVLAVGGLAAVSILCLLTAAAAERLGPSLFRGDWAARDGATFVVIGALGLLMPAIIALCGMTLRVRRDPSAGPLGAIVLGILPLPFGALALTGLADGITMLGMTARAEHIGAVLGGAGLLLALSGTLRALNKDKTTKARRAQLRPWRFQARQSSPNQEHLQDFTLRATQVFLGLTVASGGVLLVSLAHGDADAAFAALLAVFLATASAAVAATAVFLSTHSATTFLSGASQASSATLLSGGLGIASLGMVPLTGGFASLWMACSALLGLSAGQAPLVRLLLAVFLCGLAAVIVRQWQGGFRACFTNPMSLNSNRHATAPDWSGWASVPLILLALVSVLMGLFPGIIAPAAHAFLKEIVSDPSRTDTMRGLADMAAALRTASPPDPATTSYFPVTLAGMALLALTGLPLTRRLIGSTIGDRQGSQRPRERPIRPAGTANRGKAGDLGTSRILNLATTGLSRDRRDHPTLGGVQQGVAGAGDD